jgi:D-alanine-D-alanine ligase
MRITLCHQALSGTSGPDELDVLEQCNAVRAALRELGHDCQTLPCSLNLEQLARELRQSAPQLVFNLTESLADRGELIAAVPSLLDTLGLPYTGASAEALYTTSNKRLAKHWLRAAGLPVARDFPAPDVGRFIVKSVWEHASRGMDAGSVVGPEQVTQTLRERQQRFGGQFFAEEYLAGREFNVALLAADSGPEVLPISEIVFEGLPPGAPEIVDYAAKWQTESVQYRSTQRQVPKEGPGSELLKELQRLSIACWQAFDLRGYARVDFRVPPGRSPVILEVNANPCLAPDAGFAAALQRAEIPFTAAVQRIVQDAPRALASNEAS